MSGLPARISPIGRIVALFVGSLALPTGAACSSDGGASPAANDPSTFAGCSPSKAVEATTVRALDVTYDPPCIRLSQGDSLTIQASMMHPLQGMTEHGDTPNPIASNEPSTGFMQDVTVTFPDRGAFGFYCNVHGTDTSMGGTMTGVVYVE